MTDAYLIWKTIHVVSGTIVFGTGIGIAFFCWFGSRYALAHRNLAVLRMTLRFTVIADMVFTAPAVLVQLLSGAMLLGLLGWSWSSTWTMTALALIALVGACWLPVVWIQIRLSRMAVAAESIDQLPAGFFFLFRIWFGLGTVAFAAMLGIFYLMVAKPLAVS